MANLHRLCRIILVAVLIQNVHSSFTDDPVYQAVLKANPGAKKSRGNKFAIAFMNNLDRPPQMSSNQIVLSITTEQESSNFTIQTRFAGVITRGFSETSPGSSLYSRTETATRGSFTFISLPAGVNEEPDIAVQNNGQNSEADRQKGVMIEAEDPTHELTVYVFNDEEASADAYMAINCVEFPTATNYQYFVFSTGFGDGAGGENFQSQFLITPCEDNTIVSVRPSQFLSHPAWVAPSLMNTNPTSFIGEDQSDYGRLFNRFDTLMLSSVNDLTGSIITSDKPLSVFVGHQCGTPVDVGTCDYLVEQVPPHPTYGDLFFMAPFAVRQSGELYRIGSVSDGAQVTITCNCMADSGSGNRAALESSTPGIYTATVNRGQYVQCRTPEDAQTYCCVESDQPVTVMGYTLGNLVDNLANLPNLPFNPIGDPSMVYVPPATSYLGSYSLSLNFDNLFTQFRGFISYILPQASFNNSAEDQRRFTIDGEVYIPPDGYTPINCPVNGSEMLSVCAYGATRYMGRGDFSMGYENGTFWGYAYGYARDISFAYPLAFEMEPIGLAWIEAHQDTDLLIVLEANTSVDLGFRLTRGDRSARTRAFAYTEGGSAIPGIDYVPVRVRPGNGSSNLRWRRTSSTPNTPFTVTIIEDSVPEPVKTIEVRVECEEGENCFIPQAVYTITLVDPQGQCSDLPMPDNGQISYDFSPFPMRPHGTVATYLCDTSYQPSESASRTCNDSVWDGLETTCELVNCGPLNPPANGQVTLNATVFESLASYSCDTGFSLVGNATRICQADGTWSDPPTCAIDCGVLLDPPNGQVTLTGTLIESSATYTCDSGFTLVGTATRVCQASAAGFWSGETSCLIDCGTLPNPINGQVSLTGTVAGSMATYNCTAGYTITGDTTRVCQDDGNWSGSMATCRIECRVLSDPANGRVFYDEAVVGERANYTCDSGYRPVGNTTRICQGNGTWSGSPTTCQLDCGPLSHPANGRVTVTETVVGSTATYDCDTGYERVGDTNIVCQASGGWSASPRCSQADCGAPPRPDNGQVIFNGTVFESEANYSCNALYSIVGESSRVCQANGTWSDFQPSCVLENLQTIIGTVVVVTVILLLLVLIFIVLCILYCQKKVRRKLELPVLGEDSAIYRLSRLNERKGSFSFQSSIKRVVEEIPQSLRIPRTHLKMSATTLGQGEFGVVYKGLLMNWDGVPLQGVAVKALKGLFTLNDVESMVSEITKMKEFKHPHVLPLIGVCLDTGPGVSIVMPFMTNGSLLDYLRKERSKLEIKDNDPDKILTARRLLLRMCHQIALGMEYLTEQKFIHRDLAARNCMLDSDGNIRVGDFGLAEDVYASGYYRQDKKESVKMPYKWMALESLSDGIFSEKTDVWSYGVTMWEVFSGGQNPYPAVDPMTLTRLLKNGKRLDPPDNTACSDEIFAVMVRCWCKDPEKRPHFSELSSLMDHLLSLVSDYVELGMVLVEEEPELDAHEYDTVADDDDLELEEPSNKEASESKTAIPTSVESD